MNLLKFSIGFLSIWIIFFVEGCGTSNSPQMKTINIKIFLPKNQSQKDQQKLDVTIATIKLDVNSSSNIYMQDSPMTEIINKDGNYWMIITQKLPINESLSFVAKAYNSENSLVFNGNYNGVIDNQISDIILPLVRSDILIEQLPTLKSIIFNNKSKTDITFNIYNPNGDNLNYQIISSLGNFTPNQGILNFSSTLKYYSLNVTFTPYNLSNSYSSQFSMSNSDEEIFTTLFTIDNTPQESSLKLKALYSQNNKLYAINDDKTLKLMNLNLQLVKNRPAISTPIILNNLAYFSAYNETDGYEIWRSDGTEEGTSIIKDINPNNNYYTPISLINIDTKLYFSADDGIHGLELWRSDGTESSTVMIKDINPNGSSYPTELTNISDTLYFSAYDENYSRELYKSDGTANGTLKIKDINPNGNADVNYITNVNNILYFRANDGVHGLELWRSDGTTEGTYMIKDSNPNGDFDIYNLINMNGILYFASQNGNNGIELWRSDGSVIGTYMIKTINSNSNAYLENIISINNVLYFNIKDSDSQEVLWRSDGTENGTYSIKIINSTYNLFSTPLVNNNGLLYFRGKDTTYGYELWKSNGTTDTTMMVKDINPSRDSFPTYLTNVNNILYFIASDENTQEELWESNGTEIDTKKVTLPE